MRPSDDDAAGGHKSTKHLVGHLTSKAPKQVLAAADPVVQMGAQIGRLPTQIMVAHRDEMVAEAIASALADSPRFLAIGVATNAAEAERVGQRAHAAAIDDMLPGAIEVARRLRKRGVRVILLGNQSDVDELRISLNNPVATLARALLPGAVGQLGAIRSLTKRQRQVMELVASGLSGKQVARVLGISAKTVEGHKTRIFEKLGAPNMAAAVRLLNGSRVFPA